jgi:hypothetical protein
MKKIILNNIKIVSIAIILSFCLGIFYTWISPTLAQTGSKIAAAPLNVGSIGQTKVSNLLIENAVGKDYGLVIANGNVVIGMPDALPPGGVPKYKLDVKGTVSADQMCINGDCRAVWPTVGVKGATGNAGEANTTTGPAGDKGATGPAGTLSSCIYATKTYTVGATCLALSSYVGTTCFGSSLVCTVSGWTFGNNSTCGTLCGQ